MAHKGVVHALSWCRDVKKPLLASSDGNKVCVWDAAAGRLVKTLPIRANTVALSPNGQTLAAAVDNDVQLWDVESGKQATTLNGHEAPVRTPGLVAGWENPRRGRRPAHHPPLARALERQRPPGRSPF